MKINIKIKSLSLDLTRNVVGQSSSLLAMTTNNCYYLHHHYHHHHHHHHHCCCSSWVNQELCFDSLRHAHTTAVL
uniref:Uncharacterized protein n=1 Tax=Octopus bimaculoides TaxID=37653 RepID=A0A0L8GI47_OCTBM